MNEEWVLALSMSQLGKLGNELNIIFKSEISKTELVQKIICRLDWIARSSIEKSANASAWAPPPVNLYSGKDPIVQTAPVQPHVPVNNKPSIEQAAGISLKKEIETLRAENLR